MATTRHLENLIFGSLALGVVYFGDGEASLWEIARDDSRVRREWLATAHGLMLCNFCLFLYLLHGCPVLRPDRQKNRSCDSIKCWRNGCEAEEVAPGLTKLGCGLMTASLLSYTVAFWDVFHALTPILVAFLLFCGLCVLDLVPGRTSENDAECEDRPKQM